MAYGLDFKRVAKTELVAAVGSFGKFSKPEGKAASAFQEWAHYQTKFAPAANTPAVTFQP